MAVHISKRGSEPPMENVAESLTPRTGKAKDLDQLQSVLKPAGALLEARRLESRDDSAYESGDHASKEEVLILSSSPPLRPSQVSTFVPTQASVRQTATQTENIDSARPANDLLEPATVPISPYKPTHHLEALSSSPFPLPPWSSPQKVRTQNETNRGSSPHRSSQLAKLVDYSLPPPPMLHSSHRGTPASSSR